MDDNDINNEIQVLRHCIECGLPIRTATGSSLYLGEKVFGDRLHLVLRAGPPSLIELFGLPDAHGVRCAEPQPLSLALHVTLGIMAQLEVLHKAGYVFADIQPANVLLGSGGTVALVNYGGAVRTGHAAAPRSWPYCAPEQWRGQPCCERTDVFGACGVLLFLITGQAPFDSTLEPVRDACRAACLSPDRYEIVLRRLGAHPEVHSETGNTLQALRHIVSMAIQDRDEPPLRWGTHAFRDALRRLAREVG